MPDIESIGQNPKSTLTSIKKFLETNPSGWKFLLEFYLKKIRGRFLFQCNLILQSYQQLFQTFTKNAFHLGLLLSEDNPSPHLDTVNQVLWNNSFICIDSSSVYSKKRSLAQD